MTAAPRSESLLAGVDMFGMRLGLGRIRKLLGTLGDPHLAVPVVLVAGTNGKGSTAALLAAMCRAAGYRTGLYTSPHLEAVTERLVIDAQAIDDGDLARYLEEVLGTGDSLGESPTYFEALTVAAFRHFRDAGVDLAVMEVGLGGRLDATNVSEPILSLISSIALDHERHLGSSLTAVAREKSGILRRGRPAIAWTEDEEVERALCERAQAVGCELVVGPRQVQITDVDWDNDLPQWATFETTERIYRLELYLAGHHQLQNLALAILAAETLRDQGFGALDAEAIEAGARQVRWPGRLEDVELPDGRHVLLDAGHNPAAVDAVAEHVDHFLEPPDLLFGAMADKAVDLMLPAIAAVSGRVILTRAGVGRAGNPSAWSAFLEREVVVEPDCAKALDMALAGGARRVLVCGSVYLVGEVRGLLRQRFGVPAPAWS